jgi:MOSC domain-containing protein YiiM
MARLRSISVGRAQPLRIPDWPHPVVSAILKSPTDAHGERASIDVRALGLDGDEQADPTVHGGLDQAVYVYPAEHYPFWRTIREQAGHAGPLAHGALGENLTIEGLVETGAWIGDRLRIGEVELVVTKPRSPCYKLNARLDCRFAARMMVQSGYTGFYCAVFRAGTIAVGDAIELVAGGRVLTVEQAHRVHARGQRGDSF